MKKLIASALIASAALTGVASAATSTSAPAEQAIERALPGLDLTGLSTDQIVLVAHVISNADTLAQGSAQAKALVATLR